MPVRSLERDLARLTELTRRIAAGGEAEVEALLAMAGDRDLPPRITALAESIGLLVVQVEARQYHLGRIITDLERRQSELERANRDALTGLPNRAIFHDHLRKAVAGATALGHAMAVLFVDLDWFKGVNDHLGHDAGDELLRVAAMRMQKSVRNEDIVARLGGDEFTVILPSVRTEHDATDIARRIITTLAEPFSLNAGIARISASVGIALLPTHADTPEKLLKSADVAMYKAKQLGRNSYHVYCQDM